MNTESTLPCPTGRVDCGGYHLRFAAETVTRALSRIQATFGPADPGMLEAARELVGQDGQTVCDNDIVGSWLVTACRATDEEWAKVEAWNRKHSHGPADR